MSHAMMVRHLFGIHLRRTSSSVSSTSGVAKLVCPPQHNTFSSMPLFQPLRSLSGLSFSTASSQAPNNKMNQDVDFRSTAIVELPPNLIFDPRAKASPFYGAERVTKSKKKHNKGKTTKENKQLKDDSSETTSSANITQQLVSKNEKSSNQNNPDSSANIRNDNGADIEDEEEEEEEEEFDDDENYEEEDQEEERILFDLSTKPDIPRAVPLPQRLHVPVLDIRSGETVGTYHLSEKTFGNDPIRIDILHRVVVWQRNKKRGKRNAGARTKTVSEVRGSGRKVRQQKGSGKARAGHSRPAHWRGGAKAHGPKGRIQDYTTKLNKKVRKMGVRHALSQKLKEGNLIVTNDLHAPTHKTKELEIMLSRLGISGAKGSNALFIDDAKVDEDDDDENNKVSVYGGLDVNFRVASGNLQKVKMLNQMGCNVYDMLKFRKLVLSLAAVTALEQRLERDL